jgi:hypothetical protein
MPTSQGHEAIILRNGNRLKFKARTVGGAGRGFSADLLVLDEAMLLPEQALDAMMPTLRARKNPQVWFTSSAGTPDSTALWRIVKRGREGRPAGLLRVGLRVRCRPAGPAELGGREPGARLPADLDALEDDLGLLSEDGFAREHLGIWDDAAASGDRRPNAWAALADPNESAVRRRCSRWRRPRIGRGRLWRWPGGARTVAAGDAGRLPPDATWVKARVAELRAALAVPGAGRHGLARAGGRRRGAVAGRAGARRTTRCLTLCWPARCTTATSRR